MIRYESLGQVKVHVVVTTDGVVIYRLPKDVTAFLIFIRSTGLSRGKGSAQLQTAAFCTACQIYPCALHGFPSPS